MKSSDHIQRIRVVSNTHWDREFRRSFEKTRASLVEMLDSTLGLLDADPAFPPFVLDGHAILLDDYLEVRPENTALANRLVAEGRLVLGPWYTLPEQFSISAEALVRNFLVGRERTLAHGGQPNPIAYTPASWGQTGQLPRILADFGCRAMMFYRGLSHDECDAEWVWEGSDGTQVLASRFALYARYNWYYQVHRPARTGRSFSKDYRWGEFPETPVRLSDGLSGAEASYVVTHPHTQYDPQALARGIEAMVTNEGGHFTTDIFLAMNGHDISGAYPLEAQQLADARRLLGDQYDIRGTDLNQYWQELEATLDRAALPVLKGERRSYLRQGMWTFLFPGTISARTSLKLQDREASRSLAGMAEPLAVLAGLFGAAYPQALLNRGWNFLLQNHTHDANGGCAPDAVCLDMAYRYRVANDLASVVQEQSLRHLAEALSPAVLPAGVSTLVAFNTSTQARRTTVRLDLEVPRTDGHAGFAVVAADGTELPLQVISTAKSNCFVDSPWEVPVILDTVKGEVWADLGTLPALGYQSWRVEPRKAFASSHAQPSTDTLENAFLVATVNANGTVDLFDKITENLYGGLNYLRDEGEAGNAWRHLPPEQDTVFDSRTVSAVRRVTTAGPLVQAVTVSYAFAVSEDGPGKVRSARLVELPVEITYELRAGEDFLRVTTTVDNRAKDHRLRACFPTDVACEVSVADSHFDVVTRPIAVPDSTGWAETAWGTHPLQTFVALAGSQRGFSLLPAGLFEYEVLEDTAHTLALTLIRACRIRLAVSEEKMTELPDAGIQCPGVNTFSYALRPFAPVAAAPGTDVAAVAARWDLPVRVAVAGAGEGRLPAQFSLLDVSDPVILVDAVKQSQDGTFTVVRLHNTTDRAVDFVLAWNAPVAEVFLAGMDEGQRTPVPCPPGKTARVSLQAGPKGILTVGIR